MYVPPGQSLGRAFLNEFVTVIINYTCEKYAVHSFYFLNSKDVFIGLVVWAAVDPTNILVPPSSTPFVIGLA